MEGYGPSGAALVKIGAAGSKLVVTVDCGAQTFDAIAEAKAAGVEVIVVDHHQCATTLPDALALVNPNRLDEEPDAAIHGNLAARSEEHKSELQSLMRNSYAVLSLK